MTDEKLHTETCVKSPSTPQLFFVKQNTKGSSYSDPNYAKGKKQYKPKSQLGASFNTPQPNNKSNGRPGSGPSKSYSATNLNYKANNNDDFKKKNYNKNKNKKNNSNFSPQNETSVQKKKFEKKSFSPKPSYNNKSSNWRTSAPTTPKNSKNKKSTKYILPENVENRVTTENIEKMYGYKSAGKKKYKSDPIYHTPVVFVKGETLLPDFTQKDSKSSQMEDVKLFKSWKFSKITPLPPSLHQHSTPTSITLDNVQLHKNNDNSKTIESNISIDNNDNNDNNGNNDNNNNNNIVIDCSRCVDNVNRNSNEDGTEEVNITIDSSFKDDANEITTIDNNDKVDESYEESTVDDDSLTEKEMALNLECLQSLSLQDLMQIFTHATPNADTDANSEDSDEEVDINLKKFDKKRLQSFCSIVFDDIRAKNNNDSSSSDDDSNSEDDYYQYFGEYYESDSESEDDEEEDEIDIRNLSFDLTNFSLNLSKDGDDDNDIEFEFSRDSAVLRELGELDDESDDDDDDDQAGIIHHDDDEEDDLFLHIKSTDYKSCFSQKGPRENNNVNRSTQNNANSKQKKKQKETQNEQRKKLQIGKALKNENYEILDANFKFIDDEKKRSEAFYDFSKVLKDEGKKKKKNEKDQKIKQQKQKSLTPNSTGKKKSKSQLLNTNTINIYEFNEKLVYFIESKEQEFYLPDMRKSCLSKIDQLGKFYNLRLVARNFVSGGKMRLFMKTKATSIPNDSFPIFQFLERFEYTIGQKGKALGNRKENRNSPLTPNLELLIARNMLRKKHRIVAADALPLDHSNIGFLMLKCMGWKGGALNQHVENVSSRIYSTPDGKPLVEPLPASIKIGKKGIGL